MNSLVQDFGFGSYGGTVDLDIRWPNNNTETIAGVALRQTLHLEEPGCDTPSRVQSVSADLSSGAGSDVILTWEKAMGDDGWSENVTEYAICYSTTYEATSASYLYLGKVPAGTTTFTHVGGGIGDPNTYYYSVQTNGTRGTVRSVSQAVKFAKQLSPGEQLLSIPVPISNYSVNSVLRGVSFDHLRLFETGLQDPWLSYAPGRQYNDFDAFTPYQAFWIGVTAPGYFTVAGPILPTATIHLQAGWNLVGYPSTLSHDVATAVAGLGGSFVRMEGYDPSAGPYFLKRLGSSDTITGGGGYWILMSSAADWTVSFVP